MTDVMCDVANMTTLISCHRLLFVDDGNPDMRRPTTLGFHAIRGCEDMSRLSVVFSCAVSGATLELPRAEPAGF